MVISSANVETSWWDVPLAYVTVPLLVLYVVVLLLGVTGFSQILWFFNREAQDELTRLVSESELEPVTILRPLKGLDPQMEWCLESSFKQHYPADKLEIIFCVQETNDPAIPIVEKLVQKYPEIDAKLLVAQSSNQYLNPKIDNLNKGYRSAKHDILWVLDSNVYTSPGTLKRSVYTLQHDVNNGCRPATLLGGRDRRVKLVTHVPIVVSRSKHRTNWGAKLDEMFMSSSHAKFYVALNRVQPAPCINGKSNLYRRSDLDRAVGNITHERVGRGEGLVHFARYIGEDNMIGIALWDGVQGCAGMSRDIVVQPLSGQNSVGDYIARRVRWLRVRKYMVLAATMLEPTTESLLSGLIGSFAVNAVFRGVLGISWWWFLVHMLTWLLVDYLQFRAVFRLTNAALDQDRVFRVARFLEFWLLREALAFPIWLKAITGSEIEWRNHQFRILPDLSAERL